MTTEWKTHRHRTAIGRTSFSKPIQIALDSSLISTGVSVFDYGCGRGDDLRMLQRLGIPTNGWDPVHQPKNKPIAAKVVNLGYVVNVIEDPIERSQTLQKAWALAQELLIVSARLSLEAKQAPGEAFEDGCRTRRNTFQKFYTQQELREWIDQSLGVASVAAAPGIFFAFRDASRRETYLASRYRRRRVAPKLRKSDVLFEEHRPLLEPLMTFVTAHGRLPAGWELVQASEINSALGSLRRAFSIIRRVTGSEQWDRIRLERYQELLIYFALDRFKGRPRYGDLPGDLQLDVREFFSTYKEACQQADRLLFSSGNMEMIDEAAQKAMVGKLTGNALYLHVSAIDDLSPLLRVYEGCARAYIGHVEGANLIKLHRHDPKVSYLSYPDFDRDPHPSLKGSLVVPLQSLEVRYRDYSEAENPPILHRKEEFVPGEYPGRDRFVKLTRSEEQWGLYSEPATIGTKSGWQGLLEERGLVLKGHRLCRKCKPDAANHCDL